MEPSIKIGFSSVVFQRSSTLSPRSQGWRTAKWESHSGLSHLSAHMPRFPRVPASALHTVPSCTLRASAQGLTLHLSAGVGNILPSGFCSQCMSCCCCSGKQGLFSRPLLSHLYMGRASVQLSISQALVRTFMSMEHSKKNQQVATVIRAAELPVPLNFESLILRSKP
jgi:hypothetical protein